MRFPSSGNLIVAKNLEGLKKTLVLLKDNKVDYRVIGVGSNQIFPEKGGFYLKVDFDLQQNYLQKKRDYYLLPASTPLQVLTRHAIKFGLKGWECFTGIPATIGGAVFMNAGTNLGEIGPLVKYVRLITKEGLEKEFVNPFEKGLFSYRRNYFCDPGDIIFEVGLKHFGVSDRTTEQIKNYLELRQKTQPLDKKTCGCVFKNASVHKRAGKLIDLLGLKGFEKDGLRVSNIHSNFIENIGEGNFTNFKSFVKIIKDEVYLQFGIELDLEMQL